MSFTQVPTKRILVISDDLDIPHAALRLRAKGGHGGHNGLRSITERLGNTQDYPRLKVGIGRPSGEYQAGNWVSCIFSHGRFICAGCCDMLETWFVLAAVLPLGRTCISPCIGGTYTGCVSLAGEKLIV